jgi:hypothetical protein
MEYQLDRADLAHNQALAGESHAISILRIGDTVVAPEALEAWKSDFLRTLLHTTKERLKCQVRAHLNVLQHLGMHDLQRLPLAFPDREKGLGIVEPKRSTFGMRVSPRLKRFIIDSPAFLKLLLKDAPLAVREIDAVFEGFSHVLSIPCSSLKHNVCSNQSSGLKPLKQMKLVLSQG